MQWFAPAAVLSLLSLAALDSAAPYSAEWVQYNLNTNQGAGSIVTEYSGSWRNHTYEASPINWRSLPVYTIILGASCPLPSFFS